MPDQQPIDWDAIDAERVRRTGVPDVDPTVAARLRTAQARLDVWRALYPEARRRLAYDAYLSARAKSAARLLEKYRRDHGGRWDHRDAELALTAAALAIVVTDHPELITGTPPTLRRSPRDVLTDVLRTMLAPSAFGTDPSARFAGMLLDALELDGYEVTPRADRFATLDRDGRTAVRIPLRGRCSTCRGDVVRGAESRRGELLVLPWAHLDPDVVCTLDGVEVL